MTQSPSDTGGPVVVLACQRALAAERFDRADGYKLIRMPCSSKVEPVMILKAFESGARGVALIPCAEEACQYIEGNLRARSLTKETTALMTEIGLDPQRFAVYPLTPDQRTGIGDFLDAFTAQLNQLGDWL